MRIAIVHDELLRRGGAEQVVLTMLKAFPEADIYTLAYSSEGTYPEYKNFHINTSKFQAVTKNVKLMQRLYFPFAIWAMNMLHLKDYDIVIISNTQCAKYVSISKKSVVFIYTYTPFRLAWNPSSYTQYNNSKGIFRFVFNQVIKILKSIDSKHAKKGHFFLSMTEETGERVRKSYGVDDVKLIKPGLKVSNFYVSDKPKDYYLIVSRLEYYKKVDLAIDVFNQLGLKLIIVGNGTKSSELKALAKSNITFKKGLSSEELADLYANCKCLIFPQYEDYGITPLEANASGRPVIAFGKGGILETMIPYTGDASKCSAFLFKEQTSESIIKAIKLFETANINPEFIRKHAEGFDEKIFIDEFKGYVMEKFLQVNGSPALHH